MSSLPYPSWLSVAAPTQVLLAAAARSWEDTPVSESYIQQALAQPNVELDVLVSAYRYYFYKHHYDKALAMATAVCARLQTAHQWPATWDTIQPILLSQLEEPDVRLYLNAYAASGLVLARLGKVEDAERIAMQVQQIGPKEFGAEVLLNILNSLPEEDD